MDDIVLVIKTGATEVQEKLPIHFSTTMDCFPHVLIFSDYGETIDGHTIYDALDNITEDIRMNHPDFENWRRLREKGRGDLRPEELSDANKIENPSNPTGNSDSIGWRVDRFKNLPMLGKALALKPEAKWFIFADADTFISWSNLLQWTEQLDHTKPIYSGSGAAYTTDEDFQQIFAHGGSGYLLSSAAMKAGADHYAQNQEDLDKAALNHFYGDVVLATMFEHSLDLPLTWAFPMTQGGDPMVMDFAEIGYDKKLWCFPAVTYHHLTPTTMKEIWELEQDWVASHTRHREPLRHGDVFKQWLLPKLTSKDVRTDWDNHADHTENADVHKHDECRKICESDKKCMQYRFSSSSGICKTFDKIMVGTPDDKGVGMVSGWVMKHINGFVDRFDKCDGGESEGRWITS